MISPDQHRRSIRLTDYNYTTAGAYFVTIVTQERKCLFGQIADGELVLNDAGRMVQTVGNELPNHYAGVECDAFIVMPNHIHGVISLVRAGPCTRPAGKGQPRGLPLQQITLRCRCRMSFIASKH